MYTVTLTLNVFGKLVTKTYDFFETKAEAKKFIDMYIDTVIVDKSIRKQRSKEDK